VVTRCGVFKIEFAGFSNYTGKKKKKKKIVRNYSSKACVLKTVENVMILKGIYIARD